MAPSEPLFSAGRNRVLRHIAQRVALAAYDQQIIKDTQQIIRRSRKLLEETKHQVRPPSQRE